jgi:hypothetical protein
MVPQQDSDADLSAELPTSRGKDEFVCRGCYRICKRNPRLRPGEQEYCSRPSCQRLRQARWEMDRLKTDEKYREHRRVTKSESRHRCAARERNCRRLATVGFSVGPDPPVTTVPDSSGPATTRSLTDPSQPASGIRSGLFLIRPADAPESATQTVEISLVWSCRSSVIEQNLPRPETDAFLFSRSASDAAKSGPERGNRDRRVPGS